MAAISAFMARDSRCGRDGIDMFVGVYSSWPRRSERVRQSGGRRRGGSKPSATSSTRTSNRAEIEKVVNELTLALELEARRTQLAHKGDRDQDRIPDAEDECPDEPETYNGVDDQDGCPDKGPVIVRRYHLSIHDKILFARDSAELTPEIVARWTISQG
jgi:hypothetical protein